MGFKTFRTFLAIAVAVAFLIGSLPGICMADENENAPEGCRLAAKNRGPILWYVNDEEKRKSMEEDLELLKLHNQAFKAKKRRKTVGSVLFYPGAVLMAGGLLGGIFQHAIGAYDSDTGELVMVLGIGIGAGLAAPGIYLQSAKSKAEKEYEKYVQDKYKVIPILQKQKDGSMLYAMGFGMNF